MAYIYSLLVFFGGFTAWLAIGPWMRLPIVISVLFISILIIRELIYFKIKKNIGSSLAPFFLVLSTVFCTILSDLNPKSLNHILAISFVVIVVYYGVVYLLASNRQTSKKILAPFLFMSYIYSLLLIIDFCMINIYGIKLSELFVIYDVHNARYFQLGRVNSVAGPSEEPAVSAYHLVIYAVLALLALEDESLKKIVFLFVFVLVGVVVTFSSVGLLCILCISNYLFIKHFKIKAKMATILIVACVGTISLPFIYEVLKIMDFVNKIQLSSSNTSASIRVDSWITFYQLFTQKPLLGWGAGFNNSYYALPNGVHSSFFTFALNYGLIGLLPFVLFLAGLLRGLTKIFGGSSFFLWLAIVLPHSIGDYYYDPLFWIACASLSYLIAIRSKNKFQTNRVTSESLNNNCSI